MNEINVHHSNKTAVTYSASEHLTCIIKRLVNEETKFYSKSTCN